MGGPRPAFHLDPSPFPVLIPLCLASHKGRSNSGDTLLLPSAERVSTPEASRYDYISIPMQNCGMSHHQIPLSILCLLFCNLRMGAHLWPLQCLVVAADTIRRMISHSMWSGPESQETGTLVQCLQEGHGAS